MLTMPDWPLSETLLMKNVSWKLALAFAPLTTDPVCSPNASIRPKARNVP
jgi:hypothetical protein